MPVKTQLEYTDNPGALPASYTVPPGMQLVVQSIVARFDGAAASGSFLPVLSVYSQDGRLVGRFHPRATLAVGDTAIVTYAPFLNAAELDSGAVPTYGAAVRRSASQSIAPGAFAQLQYDDVKWDTAGMATGATFDHLDVNEGGLWLCVAQPQIITSGTESFDYTVLLLDVDNVALTNGQKGGRAFGSGVPALITIFPVVTLMMLEAGNGIRVRIQHNAAASRGVIGRLIAVRVGTYAT